ncbi:MAG: PilZ domain-containing protein [Phycisphaerae bacterium]
MRATIKLESFECTRAVDAAVRTQASVVLESADIPDTTINGFLISADEQALLLEVTGRPGVDFDALVGCRCEGQIYADRRYCFSSRIAAAPRWGKTQALAFDRPETVRVLDRRRFLRAKLAPSSEVSLQWKRSGTEHRHVVKLLNISADGMACRLGERAATAIDKRDHLWVTFQLPGNPQPFELGARVSNKTPASEGCTILGLQFITAAEDSATIAALRIAIEGRPAIGVPSEVLT